MSDKKKVRVLIVDDQASIRALLRTIISQMGAEIVGEAEDGISAVQQYRALLPHLVLLDINMPRLDGTQTLKQILQINPKALVIMLTSQNDANVVQQCLEAGASNFLLKNNPPEVIQQEIRDTWHNFLQGT